MINRFVVQV